MSGPRIARGSQVQLSKVRKNPPSLQGITSSRRTETAERMVALSQQRWQRGPGHSTTHRRRGSLHRKVSSAPCLGHFALPAASPGLLPRRFSGTHSPVSGKRGQKFHNMSSVMAWNEGRLATFHMVKQPSSVYLFTVGGRGVRNCCKHFLYRLRKKTRRKSRAGYKGKLYI